MDPFYRSKKMHYLSQMNLAISHLIGALQGIRNSPGANIDAQIRAIELSMQHLPQIKRTLLYIKNTETPIPTGGNNGPGPSNNSA